MDTSRIDRRRALIGCLLGFAVTASEAKGRGGSRSKGGGASPKHRGGSGGGGGNSGGCGSKGGPGGPRDANGKCPGWKK
jgi:hypothetical protein